MAGLALPRLRCYRRNRVTPIICHSSRGPLLRAPPLPRGRRANFGRGIDPARLRRPRLKPGPCPRLIWLAAWQRAVSISGDRIVQKANANS